MRWASTDTGWPLGSPAGRNSGRWCLGGMEMYLKLFESQFVSISETLLSNLDSCVSWFLKISLPNPLWCVCLCIHIEYLLLTPRLAGWMDGWVLGGWVSGWLVDGRLAPGVLLSSFFHSSLLSFFLFFSYLFSLPSGPADFSLLPSYWPFSS